MYWSAVVTEIVGGIGTSHVPAIGAAIDNGRTGEPYWKPLFRGYEKARQWMAETKPDVAIIVFNDHASAFSQELIPTFVLGVAEHRAKGHGVTSDLQHVNCWRLNGSCPQAPKGCDHL